MIWKVSKVYKATNKPRKDSHKYSHQGKQNSLFDELFHDALCLRADNKTLHAYQRTEL